MGHSDRCDFTSSAKVTLGRAETPEKGRRCFQQAFILCTKRDTRLHPLRDLWGRSERPGSPPRGVNAGKHFWLSAYLAKKRKVSIVKAGP